MSWVNLFIRIVQIRLTYLLRNNEACRNVNKQGTVRTETERRPFHSQGGGLFFMPSK